MQEELAENFFKAWDKGVEQFTLQTSGSTGSPKSILLQRQWMEWSAKNTGETFQVNNSDSIFCCLPLDKVGGLMQLVRSKVWGIPIEIAEAKANPFMQKQSNSITSLTPYQLYHVLNSPESSLNLIAFRNVLIGGADIPLPLEAKASKIAVSCSLWHGYGMTETYSHVALRQMNGPNRSDWFTCFKDVEIKQGMDSEAILYTPFSRNGLNTRDSIVLNSDNQFLVKGRLDFTINSGGVKLQPEQIEKSIYLHLSPTTEFAISSKPSTEFGEKLVLVTTNNNDFQNNSFDFLKSISPYAVPKEIIEINELPRGAGDKLDRKKLKQLLNS